MVESSSSEIESESPEALIRHPSGMITETVGCTNYLRHFFRLDVIFSSEEFTLKQKYLRMIAVFFAMVYALICMLVAGASVLGIADLVLPSAGIIVSNQVLFAISVLLFGVSSGIVNWNLTLMMIFQPMLRFIGGRDTVASKKCFTLIDSTSPELPPRYLNEEMSVYRKFFLLLSLIPSCADGFATSGLVFLLISPILGDFIGYLTLPFVSSTVTLLTFGAFYELLREKTYFQDVFSFVRSFKNYIQKNSYEINKKTLCRHGVMFSVDTNQEMKELYRAMNTQVREANERIKLEILFRKGLTCVSSLFFMGLLLTGLFITLIDSSVPGIKQVLAGMHVPHHMIDSLAKTIGYVAFTADTTWNFGLAVTAAQQVSETFCDVLIGLKDLICTHCTQSRLIDIENEAGHSYTSVEVPEISELSELSDTPESQEQLASASSVSKREEVFKKQTKRFYRVIQVVNAFVFMFISMTALTRKLTRKAPISMVDKLKNGFGAPGEFIVSFCVGNGGLPLDGPPSPGASFVPMLERDSYAGSFEVEHERVNTEEDFESEADSIASTLQITASV